MDHRELKALMTELAPVIRDYVGRSMAPVLARMEAIERRAPERGETGRDGERGVGIAGASVSDRGVLILRLTDGSDLEAGPVSGRDGKDGADGANGQDGAPGRDGDPGRDGVDGKDGKDADEAVILTAIAEEVGRAVAEFPTPKDGAPGRDGADGKDGQPGAPGRDGVDGKDGRDGSSGLDGKDGVGLAGALIDRSGDLVVTLTNGAVCALGPVHGRDGECGQDGKDGTEGLPGKDGQDGQPGAAGERGEKGEAGQQGERGPEGKGGAPGADGLGFEDMTESLEDDGRTIVRSYQRGDTVKEFRFSVPAVLDRGVYKAGEDYEGGDGVTWAGSFWIARTATRQKPGDSDEWRLAVKRGRDGKDGKPGERGAEGKAGPAGRDLTQVGPDGKKW